MRAVSEDAGIDAIIAIFTSLEMIDGPAVAQGIVQGAAGCRKPVVVCFMGNVRSREAVDLMRQAGLAVYTFPEDAARALAAMARYAQWLARPVGQRRVFEDIDRGAIDAVIRRARAEQRAQLTLAEAQRVLGHAGIPVLPWREVRSRDEALAAATELGLPLVAKISSSLIVHKSEIGGVRVGLATPHAVAAAFDEMMRDAIARDPHATLVLQQQASAGTEVIAGATRDPKVRPALDVRPRRHLRRGDEGRRVPGPPALGRRRPRDDSRGEGLPAARGRAGASARRPCRARNDPLAPRQPDGGMSGHSRAGPESRVRCAAERSYRRGRRQNHDSIGRIAPFKLSPSALALPGRPPPNRRPPFERAGRFPHRRSPAACSWGRTPSPR